MLWILDMEIKKILMKILLDVDLYLMWSIFNNFHSFSFLTLFMTVFSNHIKLTNFVLKYQSKYIQHQFKN